MQAVPSEHVTHVALTQWLFGRNRLENFQLWSAMQLRLSCYLSDAAATAAAAVTVLSGHVAHADQLVTVTCEVVHSAELSANKWTSRLETILLLLLNCKHQPCSFRPRRTTLW